jgi:lipoprotein NlpI
MKLRNFSVVLIFLTLTGCAGSPQPTHFGKELVEEKHALSVKEEQLAQRDEEIKRLRGLLAEKEAQLKEKEAKIEELKSQLSNFGVF